MSELNHHRKVEKKTEYTRREYLVMPGGLSYDQGDTVVYVSDAHNRGASNPLWGHNGLFIQGVVQTMHAASSPRIKVIWNNSTSNVYHKSDLRRYKPYRKEIPVIEKAKSIATSVHEIIKPYEKYIGLAALVLVIDHFMFDGRFSHRLKAVVEKLVEKSIAAIDKMLEKIGIDLFEDEAPPAVPPFENPAEPAADEAAPAAE